MIRLSAAILILVLTQCKTCAEPLNEAQIKALVTGNTVTGRTRAGNRFFSEYHLADGRVLGNSSVRDNTDACWTTKNNQICYYYGLGKQRTTFCFEIETVAGSLILNEQFTDLRPSMIFGYAKVETGNPRGHSDAGQSWTCDGLISGLFKNRVKLSVNLK